MTGTVGGCSASSRAVRDAASGPVGPEFDAFQAPPPSTVIAAALGVKRAER